MENVNTFYGHLVILICCHLVCSMVIWYIFSRFGMLHREKSDNHVVYIQHAVTI
jgi:hypothetical protein